MVREFIEKVRLEASYTFAIGTYGNMPGAVMNSVQKLAEKNGNHFDYVNDLLMLDNFLPVFEVGAEIEKLPQKKIEKMTEKIVEDIKSRRHRKAEASMGTKMLTSVVSKMPTNGKGAQKYIVNDQCTRCGTCVKVCPTNNIKLTDKISFSDRCLSCYACLHLCPYNAIHLKNEKSDQRWRNPEVPLKEIINANNRSGQG
jgi:ferredoxin